jgi:hypothetical protein
VIGPSGGQVTGDSASVAIPPGALATSTTITLTPTEAAPPTSTVEVGTPILFGPEGTQFATPVTVTLELSNLAPTGKTANDVVIYTAPKDSTAYQALSTTVVDASHVSAQTPHFSIFVATVASQQPDVDAAVDAPPSGCTPAFSGGPQACTFTAICNGVHYMAQCTGTGCTCTIEQGQPTQVSLPGGQVCFQDGGSLAFSACGFP